MAELFLTGATAAASAGAGNFLSTVASTAVTTAAGLAVNALDQAIFGEDRRLEGPRLSEVSVQGSTEGAPIARIYGRTRLSGQIIWASNFKEVVTENSQSGGKGFGGPATTTREYSYFISFAVALCEGEITRIGQIWADGKPLDIANVTYRLYQGSDGQTPDPLIEALEGAGHAPGYRGTAYVVFENLALAGFGNRIPQLSFEVFRALDGAARDIRAVAVIPGASEYAYDPEIVFSHPIPGFSRVENAHNNSGLSDWRRAIDDLEADLPNAGAVALVVSWFGDDLRVDQCELRPRVEVADKPASEPWSVAGLVRGQAPVVSTVDDRPAFGGTPSDSSVIRAIQDLKARGLNVHLYPFIMMDVPAGNSLPDPYTGASEQPAYPWRGRITVDPAPGLDGTPDKTAAAGSAIETFFSRSWGYRNFILHYADLAVAAGGVDSFLIGSEMRGLTQLRSDVDTYPAIAHLKTLAADVKARLGETKISYAADWSEYFGHQPADGSGDVYFNLDPLWADGNIDFVGIDNYLPLSDWREGQSHLDAQSYSSIYDLDYLTANIRGGEGYDWFYASDADRASQQRTAITDGAGKPWVFRNKDIWNWWSNQHFNRPGGVESQTPTGWVPQSKPVVFTELGCPAIDKGSNQPNVFVDPKSAETATPYFSRGTNDDLIQRRFIETHMRFWNPAGVEFEESNNPISGVYGDRMVPADRIYIWSWDARPFPHFPRLEQIWSDGPNWALGHWITGRILGADLNDVVRTLLKDADFTLYDVSALSGVVDGFVIDRIMSPRDALVPLMQAFAFDAVESDGLIRFAPRGQAHPVQVEIGALAVGAEQAESPFELTRGQETELPVSIRISYLDGEADYRRGAVEARRLTGFSSAVSQHALAVVMRQPRAQAIADILLQQIWVGREKLTLKLPPSRLALDAGDVIELEIGGRPHEFRIDRVLDDNARKVEARRQQKTIYDVIEGPSRKSRPLALDNPGPPHVKLLDLPLISGAEIAHAPHIAGFANPWPGQIAVYRAPAPTGFVLDTVLESQAVMGQTQSDFYQGPTSRWDRGNQLWVRLFSDTLEGKTGLAVLNGGNIAAVENEDGEWEVIQFADAELVDVDTYRLSQLLRGQAGSEAAMRNFVAAGASFVLLTGALKQPNLTLADRNLPQFWRYGPASRGVVDPTYRTEQRIFKGAGLRPLSPVHIRGSRAGNGDITISCVRRTRLSGDSWDQIEVPLGEDHERYETEIMDGGDVLRTIPTANPELVYTAAQQSADFGVAPQSPLTVRISQISNTFGRGSARTTTLFV